MAAVSELCDRLDVIGALDAAVGPVKQRDRGFGAGELLTGIAAAQLAGEDFLVGLDCQREDAAGQLLAPVPGLSSTTAAGLARRITAGQWQAVEHGVAAVTERMLELLPAGRAAALAEGPVTIDLDTTDVEVYGRKKRGVAYNHQGQRAGRPHVAAWAETEIVLAADLGSGTDDPRASAPDLLRRALAALPRRARAGGRIAARVDAGYFAGQVARAAHDERIAFAIGARRIAPLWRLLDGISENDWTDAIDMDNAQVAVADYRPDWWPANTSLLIRRARLEPEQVSADPRSRRRRTLHPGQRALPIPELAEAGAIYGYSFILTNLDVSAPDKAAAAEHWYRHRTTIETSKPQCCHICGSLASLLGQGRAVGAGGDVGALDACSAQQVADRVGSEGRAAFGWAEALGVEAVGDLRGGQPGVCQVAGPPGQLGVVAELGQAGHRAADLGGGAVPVCPYHLHVYLLAGAEHLDADLLDQMADQLLAVGVGGGGRVPATTFSPATPGGSTRCAGTPKRRCSRPWRPSTSPR
jgi:hypothetical protein